MSLNFWKDKKVLITGHTGFKGSWLTIWLQSKGAWVIGYSLPPPTKPSLFEKCNIAKGMISTLGDVRDIESLKKCIQAHRPEIIVHMAAQALVRYSYVNPIETYSTNVMGTVNVLEAARQSDGVKVVLIVTTDKCYKNNEWIWGYRENDPIGGYDPYASSKGCAELVTSAYTTSYFSESAYTASGVAIASVRAGNVIGGGDWAEDRLIPDIIRAIIDKKEIKIRNPQAIRPWQHVLEPLSGYMCLIEKLWSHGPKFSGGWNFGPNNESCKPVSFILDSVRNIWGDECRWVHESSEAFHEANFLKLDCSKAYSLLSWSPKLDLKTALKLTLEWYRKFIKNENMRKLSEQQITFYEMMER